VKELLFFVGVFGFFLVRHTTRHFLDRPGGMPVVWWYAMRGFEVGFFILALVVRPSQWVWWIPMGVVFMGIGAVMVSFEQELEFEVWGYFVHVPRWLYILSGVVIFLIGVFFVKLGVSYETGGIDSIGTTTFTIWW